MSERKITVTIKGGEQYDAPWIVFGGDTIQEIEYDLDQFHQTAVMGKIVHLAALMKEAHTNKRREFVAQQNGPAQGQSYTFQEPEPAYDPSYNQGYDYQPPQSNPGNVWGGGPVQQQKAAQPQQGRCQCGEALLPKTTGSGKTAMRCPNWRWNNGNPTTNHDQQWVN